MLLLSCFRTGLALGVLAFLIVMRPAVIAAALPLKPDVVVAADGSGDFKSVHAAVQSIPKANRERKLIFIKDGVYHEKVRIDAACVTLHGESRAGTHIEFPQGMNDYRGANRDNI